MSPTTRPSTRWSRGSSRSGAGSMSWSQMPAADGRPMDTKASTLDPALLQLVVGMNLFGTVYSVNAVAPVMKEQRSGKIITVSSVAGTHPSADGG
jgi:NAD(P)-dependent dehydrogenase (short-subunit alcohol dehydrogenase family)